MPIRCPGANCEPQPEYSSHAPKILKLLGRKKTISITIRQESSTALRVRMLQMLENRREIGFPYGSPVGFLPSIL
jgi:hypothetical protein